MASFELLGLDLRSPILYAGLENPPLSGAPISGRALLPGTPFPEAGLGEDLLEDEEELFVFEEAQLVSFDPDEGPRLSRPLPRPAFYGRRMDGGGYKLSAGSYSFLQWRVSSEAELMDGLEWFARELWWERADAIGPYLLRRLREEGKIATQALRRTKGPSSIC
jgi:hypothetical protein